MPDERSNGTVPAPPAPTAATSGTKMIVTMGAIGLVCGVLIVGAYQVTLPAITKNKAKLLEEAILAVIPAATSQRTFAESGGALSPADDASAPGARYYAGYNDANELVGVAVETSGMGFADVVRVIYGYSPEKRAIVGLKVLESHETPGLGTKIETEARFRANFDSLLVAPSADGATVENPIALAKRGEKEHAWQVEAITGATISSRALADMLRASTETTVPVITRNLDVLKGGAP
jgi:electron transport complex protein RnfG